ncbi:MAG: hypothetical protein ACJ746_05325 [Bryobacteraceae bacterium]
MLKLSLSLVFAAVLTAHPMGNFSVSHYSGLTVTPNRIEVRYVLDLAEIPTFELLQSWNVDRSASADLLHKHAIDQCRDWLSQLSFTAGAHTLSPQLGSVKAIIADGAGGLPIIRVELKAHVDDAFGSLRYEDHNYAERAGWKEIVIDAGPSALLTKTSGSNRELSKALTQYPPDPTFAPPQDLRAEVEWRTFTPVVAPSQRTTSQSTAPTHPQAVPVVTPIAQPHATPAAPVPASLTPQAAPLGLVVRGDYLSRALRGPLTFPVIFFALTAAFALGAAHALTPGHGKAIVAAYLVGSRGTLQHAAFLGAAVTFTHTVVVFALGLATLFLFRFIVPEKLTAILGVVSGLSIVAIGAWMFRKRLRHAAHSRKHSHSHEGHSHHEHSHHHRDHHHERGEHTHTHVPDEISWKGLMALGVSGGLVPCESALVLLLGAIAIGRVGLGLLLLVSFSLGLALVLTGIGALVLYAKNLLPATSRNAEHPLLRYVSVASPAIVIIVGIGMTAASLGWVGSKWTIG